MDKQSWYFPQVTNQFQSMGFLNWMWCLCFYVYVFSNFHKFVQFSFGSMFQHSQHPSGSSFTGGSLLCEEPPLVSFDEVPTSPISCPLTLVPSVKSLLFPHLHATRVLVELHHMPLSWHAGDLADVILLILVTLFWTYPSSAFSHLETEDQNYTVLRTHGFIQQHKDVLCFLSVSSLVILNIWCTLFDCYWALNWYFNETIYHNTKIMLLRCTDQPHHFRCRIGLIISSFMYIIFTYTEFHLSFLLQSAS